MVLTRGWARAHVRPWNDEASDVAIRLERGGSRFLEEVAVFSNRLSDGDVFSPALYGTATPIWRRAGFGPHIELDIMEARLSPSPRHATSVIRLGEPQDLQPAADIDYAAFRGFWRIGKVGLKEAIEATSRSVMLVLEDDGDIAGYAIVGYDFGTAFLQRIAVDPSQQGKGLGRSLLASSAEWALARGARSILLNVRPDNNAAIEFYKRNGFEMTDKQLHVLKFG